MRENAQTFGSRANVKCISDHCVAYCAIDFSLCTHTHKSMHIKLLEKLRNYMNEWHEELVRMANVTLNATNNCTRKSPNAYKASL